MRTSRKVTGMRVLNDGCSYIRGTVEKQLLAAKLCRQSKLVPLFWGTHHDSWIVRMYLYWQMKSDVYGLPELGNIFFPLMSLIELESEPTCSRAHKRGLPSHLGQQDLIWMCTSSETQAKYVCVYVGERKQEIPRDLPQRTTICVGKW